MRASRNQSSFRQSMLNALGALGQIEATYTVLPGGAGCRSGQGFIDPSREAKKKYAEAKNVPYKYIVELFGNQNIELADPDSWYIGGGSQTPGRCSSIESDLWGFGFNLARANGTVQVPKWIYSTGMSEASIADAAAKSNAEAARGQVKTCVARFANTTPTQAAAIVRDSERVRGIAPWEIDCLRTWSTQTAPAGGASAAAIAAAAAAAAAAANKIVNEFGPLSPPTTACRAGYKRPPAGGHITCLPGYGIDVDASGCEACVSACSPGWSPPDQAPRECQPGESFQVDPRTRCVRCARGSNCWTTGMAPVPCPAPFVVQQRGAYSCCVSPQSGGGQQQTSQPSSQGPVPAPGQDVMPAMSIPGDGLSKGWIIAGAALIAVIAFGGSSGSKSGGKKEEEQI